MCMGRSKSNNTQPPPPAQPTTFQYVNGDTSAQQHRQNVVSQTQAQPASFGSELGAGGATPSTPMAGAAG